MGGRRFVWKIENFSCIKCETILIYHWGWKITINLFASSQYIGIELKRTNMIYYYCNLSIALLDSEGSPLLWREKKNIAPSQFLIHFDIKKDTIFGSMRDKFLPNDTLRVQLIEWDKPEDLLYPMPFFTRSRIIYKIIKKTFSWNIKNVNSLELDPILGQVELFTSEGDAKLSTNGLDELTIQLFLGTSLNMKLSASLTRAQQVECTISVLDAKGKIIQFVNEEHHFDETDEVWTFDIPITKGMLMYYRKEFLPNDTLSLVFSCTFFTNEIRKPEFVYEQEIFVKNSHPNVALPLTLTPRTSSDEPEKQNLLNNTISQALMSILEEGLLSDFSFLVQHKAFPVHKNILSARSSVFRAMFTADMKEKESSSVDIPDVDADTFQRMLNFIYSDSFEDDMQWESASKLYSVADKYDLEPLKQKCSRRLESGLCVTSVLEVLLLGDKHRDDDLKAAAVDFIAKDSKKFIACVRWRSFAEKNLQLAFDTLQSLFVKKVDV